MTAPLLYVRGLSVEFPLRRQRLQALDGISFSLEVGEVLGFVGESGAGKSLTGAAIMGLLEPPGRITAGTIALQGRRIEDYAASVRGGEIGMIFQDPLTSLNPLRTVGDQLVEPIQLHLGLSGEAAEARARLRRRLWQRCGARSEELRAAERELLAELDRAARGAPPSPPASASPSCRPMRRKTQWTLPTTTRR